MSRKAQELFRLAGVDYNASASYYKLFFGNIPSPVSLLAGWGECCLTSREVVRIGGEHLRSICFTLPGTWQTGGTWEVSDAFPSSVGGVRAAPNESSEKCLDRGANRPHLKGRFIPWECQDVWPWATSVPSHGKSVLRVIRGAPNKKDL